MKEAILKACPFCGGNNIFRISESDYECTKSWIKLMCSNCYSRGPSFESTTTDLEAELIQAWNTRPVNVLDEEYLNSPEGRVYMLELLEGSLPSVERLSIVILNKRFEGSFDSCDIAKDIHDLIRSKLGVK